jgi:lipopolysaccharide cholinephosphotransferase
MVDNHSELLEGYKDIASVLDRHGITFYGFFGTTIGAVRHKGFIPWDDDLDIAIFAKDLDEVNRVLSEELDPQKYYYHNPSADSHPHVIIKTDDFETTLRNRKATFIDIFVLTDFPDSKIRQYLMYPFCGFELLSHKMIDEHPGVKGLFYGIMHISRKFIRMISQKDSKMVSHRAVEVWHYTWYREDFGTPLMVDFEDTKMPIPCNYDRILTMFYGDYMTPPPEDKRSGATGYPYGLLNDYLEDTSGGKKHPRLSSDDLPY